MARIPRILITGDPTVYHVISRTALEGFPLADIERDFLVEQIKKASQLLFHGFARANADSKLQSAMSKKQNILHTATRLFAEKGYRNTSIAEIAKLTEVAEGTIFYHFKTKEELYLAILKNVREIMNQELARFFAAKKFASGLDRLEGSIFFLPLSGEYSGRTVSDSAPL